jgi:hypothetical protein
MHKIAKNMQIRQNSNPTILKVVGNNPLTPYIFVNDRLKRISGKESKKHKTMGKGVIFFICVELPPEDMQITPKPGVQAVFFYLQNCQACP